MLPQILRSIPLPNLTSFQRQALAARILGLNCLTTYYADLWERNFTPDFCQECFASDDRALSQNYFANLTPNWQASCALRTDLERRQALLEIDVLSAMGYGISLADLETCYRLGFRVLADYEAATYYDQSGRIVCTPNRQLGKGLPLKGKAETDVTWAVDGAVTEALGFEDVKDKKSGTVSKTFRDDTLPGGPKTRTITWQAPFFTRDRLADYAAAWRHFSAEEKR